jgi:hypothetical protein
MKPRALGRPHGHIHVAKGLQNRIMPSRQYRKNAEECRDHAARARNSEDRDAWLATAEEWQKLAEELEAAQQQSWKFWKRPVPGVAPKHQPGAKIKRRG